MQRYLRERDISRCSESTKTAILYFSVFTVLLFYWSSLTLLEDLNPWVEYQRAKMDTQALRSTVCRIEDTIVEAVRPDQNKTGGTISFKCFFILRVINSTNEQDQFKVEEVSLVSQPGQQSLINSSLACFYDPTGIKQARSTLPDLSKAKEQFILWSSMGIVIVSGCVWFGLYCILIALRKIHQLIRSRRRTTDDTTMELINFV